MNLSKSFKILKASSIVETIIAIVLISICSLVALSVYLNVISQNNPVYYYEAKHKVNELAQLAQRTQDFDDDTFKFQGYTITKSASVKANEHIAILDFVIATGEKTYTITKLIEFENGH